MVPSRDRSIIMCIERVSVPQALMCWEIIGRYNLSHTNIASEILGCYVFFTATPNLGRGAGASLVRGGYVKYAIILLELAFPYDFILGNVW